MLHQYLKNLFNNKIKASIVLALISLNSLSQTGLVESYKNLIKQKNQSLLKSSNSESGLKRDWNKPYSKVYFEKNFLNSILLHTPKRFLKLGTKDKCSFYDLILSNTLRSKDGEIKEFSMIIEDKNNKAQSFNVSRADFIRHIVSKECPNSINFSLYFTAQNLKKTLQKFSFKVPKNQNECREVHNYYLKDHKTPYFCYLNQEMKKIPKLSNKIALTSTSDYKKLEKLKKQINKARAIDSVFKDSAKSYLNNMCQNIDKEKKFCDFFFDQNFFKRIKERKADPFFIRNTCLEIFRRTDKKILATCIDRVVNQPESCMGINNQSKALYPRPNCNEISKALTNTRLNAKENDCPSHVQNDTIVNISRLVRHFSKEPVQINKDCKLNAVSSYAAYNLDFNGENFWTSSVCYDDKILDKEVCAPTLLGDSSDADISLSENIKKILIRKRGFSKTAKCNVLPRKKYNPLLLKYKTGCFILTPSISCLENCKNTILLDQEEVKFIKFKSSFNQDYFPSSYLNEGKSQVKLLVKNLKLKTRPILNTSILKLQYKNHPKSILHAVACAEHLYPNLFKLNSINKCSPIGVIIDSYIEENSEFSVILRSSIDSLEAPRIIPWRDLFSAIKFYQSIHPLNTWTLYALYN